VSQYQEGKTSLDFTEAKDSQWQWHQLGHMQVCNSLQTDNHASTPPLSFLQAGCPSCHPTNNFKALKANRHGNNAAILYNNPRTLTSVGRVNDADCWKGQDPELSTMILKSTTERTHKQYFTVSSILDF